MNRIRMNKTYQTVLLVVFLIMILLDATLLILFLNDYLLFFFTGSRILALIGAHFFMLILFSLAFYWARAILIITIPMGICIGVGSYLYVHYALPQWSYQYFDSPRQTNTVVLRYRAATLGESQYFFEFYQKPSNKMLMHHRTSYDFKLGLKEQEKYRGIQNVQWLNESTIQFDVQGVSKTLSLD
ncbi:hypothetical protein COHCIP112018_04208 [Cohnella sp. JJ-181]|nr:hypothetical protein COHCIP112018_04208 [Cohnella sp. JJ-181]